MAEVKVKCPYCNTDERGRDTGYRKSIENIKKYSDKHFKKNNQNK